MLKLGAAAIAQIAHLLRKTLIPVMQQIDEQIQSSATSAARKFRAVHGSALLINLVQLLVLAWGTTRIFS